MTRSSYAAPGDTVNIVTNVRLAAYYSYIDIPIGTTKLISSVSNTSINATISNIVFDKCGTYMLSGYGSTSPSMPGSITYYLKKNGINGPIVWQETYSNISVSSGRFNHHIPANAAKDITLYPGETLDLVVLNNMTYTVQTSNWYSDSWYVNYWRTDYLVQQGVDYSREARDAANAANINAYNASYYGQTAANAANNANTSAQGAKTSADTAATRAQTTVNQTWYGGAYGGASENVADIAGYIRIKQLPELETKMNNLQVAINNIENNDTSPPTVDVQTVSGSRATSASSIQAVVTVTDNRPGPYTYSVNGGSYSTLPANGIVSLPVLSPGNNSITINVKDVAGNVGSKTIVIRKL